MSRAALSVLPCRHISSFSRLELVAQPATWTVGCPIPDHLTLPTSKTDKSISAADGSGEVELVGLSATTTGSVVNRIVCSAFCSLSLSASTASGASSANGSIVNGESGRNGDVMSKRFGEKIRKDASCMAWGDKNALAAPIPQEKKNTPCTSTSGHDDGNDDGRTTADCSQDGCAGDGGDGDGSGAPSPVVVQDPKSIDTNWNITTSSLSGAQLEQAMRLVLSGISDVVKSARLKWRDVAHLRVYYIVTSNTRPPSPSPVVGVGSNAACGVKSSTTPAEVTAKAPVIVGARLVVPQGDRNIPLTQAKSVFATDNFINCVCDMNRAAAQGISGGGEEDLLKRAMFLALASITRERPAVTFVPVMGLDGSEGVILSVHATALSLDRLKTELWVRGAV